MKHGSIAILLAAAAMVATPAGAGDRSPMSALPTAIAPVLAKSPPPTLDRAAGVFTRPDGSNRPGARDVVVDAAKGYCFVDHTDYGVYVHTVGSFYASGGELWRLVEQGDAATLERARIEVHQPAATFEVHPPTRVVLRRVARVDARSVWAARDERGDVLLLVSGASIEGREAAGIRTDSSSLETIGSDCAFGLVRLSGRRARTGSVATLRGIVPGDEKAKAPRRFAVHASLAQVGTDPEPTLAVRVTEM